MDADLTSKPSCLRLLCHQHEACYGGPVVLCLHTHTILPLFWETLAVHLSLL